MFNIQPGTGLGFTASKEIVLGLGTGFAIVEVVRREVLRLISHINRIMNLISEL